MLLYVHRDRTDYVQCCFTSTETVQTIRDVEPIVQCCFTSTETVQTIRDVSPLFSVALHPQRPYRLLGTGRPGRAPLLSHSSLLLFEESKDVFNRGQCISMLLLKISSVAMEGNGAQSVMCGKGD